MRTADGMVKTAHLATAARPRSDPRMALSLPSSRASPSARRATPSVSSPRSLRPNSAAQLSAVENLAHDAKGTLIRPKLLGPYRRKAGHMADYAGREQEFRTT